MTSPPSIGLPHLLPPTPSELSVTGSPTEAAAKSTPCEAVTRQALQELSNAITVARDKAEGNVAVNGEGVPDAGYPGAATWGRYYLVSAHDMSTDLLAWVDEWNKWSVLIHYPAISYGIYGYCREVIGQLHLARHWETISAVYNAVRGTAATAVECVDLITATVALSEPLSVNATHCYLAAYGL
jgi:hypothetical protein